MTTFAWIFMLGSMGSVTALMVYCFYRVLSEPVSGSASAAGAGPPDAGSSA